MSTGPSDYIMNVCKIGQGAECCKYLLLDPKGFSCAKPDPNWKRIVDENWATNEHVAQGDNCMGQKELSKQL